MFFVWMIVLNGMIQYKIRLVVWVDPSILHMYHIFRQISYYDEYNNR